MVRRLYVEKKPGLRQEAQALCRELQSVLGIHSLTGLRLVNRYDVEGLDEAAFQRAARTVFSEPQTDDILDSLESFAADANVVFASEPLPGQFDQRADSAMACIQLMTQGERPQVRTAKVYLLYGKLTEANVKAIKQYVINPVESRGARLKPLKTLKFRGRRPPMVERVRGFTALNDAGLAALMDDMGLAMDMDDLRFLRNFFRDTEHRDPTVTEIRVVDTYWSDHCRHTTFSTCIDAVEMQNPDLRDAYRDYLNLRREVYGDSAAERPQTLMDIATLGAKVLKKRGVLRNTDESEEINACSVRVRAQVDRKPQDWLVMFKNETHNHPTEIEPFGGAATCIGGCIRDPLSGRTYVYQSMRVSGCADPRTPLSETIPGKLPQRKLAQTSAAGYSSYGNQIGLATGVVSEVYHPGYAAKHLETGAVIGAAPAENVFRARPEPGDVVILIGGRTGRDGIGGATGSSKSHNRKSLTSMASEVQKGNAPEERKLQRLFRNGNVTKMIRRCNDFGAGGVSVAIGELADGMEIDLDAVRKKYTGLDGTELAISESQERMAVVVSPENVSRFTDAADRENLEAYPVAVITESPRMVMKWQGETIVNLSRAFLNTNGAPKHITVRVAEHATKKLSDPIPAHEELFYPHDLRMIAADLRTASRRGLAERFDSTVGAGSVFMPFGGKYQRTPSQVAAALLPVAPGQSTESCSVMAWGFDPFRMSADPFYGAQESVIVSVAKLCAAGCDYHRAYLTLQEYFAKPGQIPERWGQPFAALLGALRAQMKLGIAAIGGKDSMSGTFMDMDVPPTLISFAVAMSNVGEMISSEFSASGHTVYVFGQSDDFRYEDIRKGWEAFYTLCRMGRVKAARAVENSVAEAVMQMSFGNAVGFRSDTQEELSGRTDFWFPSFWYTPCAGMIVAEVLDGTIDAPYTPRVITNNLAFGVKIGATIAEPEIIIDRGDSPADRASIAELLSLNEQVLEDIYPNRTDSPADIARMDSGTDVFRTAENMGTVKNVGTAETVSTTENISTVETFNAEYVPVLTASPAQIPVCANVHRTAKAKVLIPVFPGTNCEYDSERAVLRAGLKAETFVINNRSAYSVAESAKRFAKKIRESQIIFIPGGFSGGDEPDGSGKFITAFFRNPETADAVQDLLENRDGLMLGICNGFQALIKLGLVPYGKIMDTDASCPTLTYNLIARHQSRIVRTRIASVRSPWMTHTAPGQIVSVPISHGEGRFLCSAPLLEQLAQNGQIATQYVDFDGNPSMDIDFNPNGSAWAVEGIFSPDGRVFGKMGHSERTGPYLYRNVPGDYNLGLFESARDYFSL